MVMVVKIEIQIHEGTIKALREAYIEKGYPDPFNSGKVTQLDVKGAGPDGKWVHQDMLDSLITDFLELELNELAFETGDSLSTSMQHFKASGGNT